MIRLPKLITVIIMCLLLVVVLVVVIIIMFIVQLLLIITLLLTISIASIPTAHLPLPLNYWNYSSVAHSNKNTSNLSNSHNILSKAVANPSDQIELSIVNKRKCLIVIIIKMLMMIISLGFSFRGIIVILKVEEARGMLFTKVILYRI